MSQRAYCDQPHPIDDAAADEFCERHHRPDLPNRLPEGTTCGIHGLPTETGRCSSCDSDLFGPTYDAGHVLEAKTGGYLVQSRTTPGCWWLVFERSCSCPAGRSGSASCWHRRQVAAFVAKLNEAMKRPVAPVNVSALVD